MAQGPIQVASFIQNAKTRVAQFLQGGQQQEAFVGQRHAPHYEAVYAGNVGMVASAAGVTTTVGLATTYTGLLLANPAASKVNLAIIRASAALIVAPAGIVEIGLAVGTSALSATTAEPGTVQNALVGGGNTLNALAYKAAILASAPLYARHLGVNASAGLVAVDEELNGSLLIPPGAFVMFTTSSASGASGFVGSIVFEEVPQ